MITDKEIAEYRTLCAALAVLHEKYIARKRELRLLLEETAALRRDTLLVLAKANRLTRHLTGRQRYITGLSYRLDEIKARIEKINQEKINQFSPVLQSPGGVEEKGVLSDLADLQFRENYRSRRELRQRELVILEVIDAVKKTLLQLDLLELRCRELILSLNKAMEAFHHESRIIRGKIYPFGIFSLFYRFLRSLWGRAYFSSRDLKDVTDLGKITGYVLKIADSPII